MKASFKINLVFVITLIALSFITSAHATKPHFLKKPPMLLTTSPSSVNKSTKTLPYNIDLAARWNDSVSQVQYLKNGTDPTMTKLTKNQFVTLGGFPNLAYFLTSMYIAYTNSQGKPVALQGFISADSNDQAGCVRAWGDNHIDLRGRPVHFDFYKFKKNDGTTTSVIGTSQAYYLVKVAQTKTFCGYPKKSNFFLDISALPNLGVMSIKIYFTNGSSDHYINSLQRIYLTIK